MFARAQNTSSAAAPHIKAQSRRALIRVNMSLSRRRVLHDYPINNRPHKRLRPGQCHARLCKTSRDPLASLNTKRVVRLSSMTSQPRHATTNGNTYSVPRFLSRPEPRPIQLDSLRTACPELDDVSLTFVRRQLTSMAPNMLAGVEITTINRENISELASELPISFADRVTAAPPVAPTHILALSVETQPDAATLFAIHQLPFAANCSGFPALPSSSTATTAGNRSSTATLPVIRMILSSRFERPSIQSFQLFQIYLYVRNPEALRAAFLPSDWTTSIEKTMEAVLRIKGFWSIACAMGMQDDEMFDVIEESWAEVLRVLDRAT